MSYIPGDEHQQDEPFDYEPAADIKCELCEKATPLADDVYCQRCRTRTDLEEMAMPQASIPLITQRPVPGPTFAEIKRVLDKVQS